MADYKSNELFTEVSVAISIGAGAITLAKLDDIKFLASEAKIPQTAKVEIEPGQVRFTYRIPKKKPSNLPYPDGKQEYRRFVTEF